jgi:hypothetical protein
MEGSRVRKFAELTQTYSNRRQLERKSQFDSFVFDSTERRPPAPALHWWHGIWSKDSRSRLLNLTGFFSIFCDALPAEATGAAAILDTGLAGRGPDQGMTGIRASGTES